MPTQPPRPLNKALVRRAVTAADNDIRKPEKLLAAFDAQVLDCWDLTKMSASDLCALHEQFIKTAHGRASLVALKLRK
jgi:hypothetical protein